MQKSVITKVIFCGVIFLVADTSVFSPLNSITATSTDTSSLMTHADDCYGVIIPLIQREHLPYTSIQQSITNMVNDLLRINIDVFWAAVNFSSLTRTLVNDSTQIRFFEQGAFIVPFTKNDTTNALIISITTDYTVGSEIETYYPIALFFIMEPFTLEVHPLQYAKCAMRFGLNCGYIDVYMYSDILYSSGFLDTHLLLDDELDQKLNNSDFNLLIWPGAVINVGATSFLEDVNVAISGSIRRFVNNGGGYIASCYGADAASSGPIVPFLLPFTRLRNVPSIGFLALTSSSVLTINCRALVTVAVTNRSHPVAFGLDPIQESWHAFGPVFPKAMLDRNTHVIGVLDDLQVDSWRNHLFDIMPPQLFEIYLNFIKGTPIWISSSFGEGKVVLFGYHPEFQLPNRQDRVIDNAVFYVTSNEKIKLPLTSSMVFSELIAISIRSSDIPLPLYQPFFTEIWNTTNLLNATSSQIDNALSNIGLQITRICEERFNEYTPLTWERYFQYTNHDSYQYWLGLFTKAAVKLEQVYALTKNTKDISSTVSLWRIKTNTDLDELADECMRLYENCTILLKSLENYVGFSPERTQTLVLIDAVELLYRKGHVILNQLWSSTVKTYRDIWYTYESNYSINTVNSNETSLFSLSEKNIPSDQQPAQQENHILYVDSDAWIGGDGSGEHPYQRIQDAIEAADDGDTILVQNGIYYEHLYIDKSIHLVGEDINTTIIDGQNTPNNHITICAPNVELTNFTIQNSEQLQNAVILYSSNNTIRRNIIKNNGCGLGFYTKSSNNTITENQFIHNHMGVIIYPATPRNNCFERNTFQENVLGLYAIDSYNIIRDNVFIDDDVHFISLEPNLLVMEITNNTVNGKPLVCYKNQNNFQIVNAGAIIISNCTNGLIENITINKTDTGIYMINSSNIYVVNCTLSSNLIGIVVMASSHINILRNMIFNNEWSGIWLQFSNNNQFSNNSIVNNTDGIYCYTSSSNTIHSNNMVSNILGLSSWYLSYDNSVYENNFIKNHENAFDMCRDYWDANYWDTWIGVQSNVFKFLPYHIPGRVLMNYDWHPAPESYGKSVVN